MRVALLGIFTGAPAPLHRYAVAARLVESGELPSVSAAEQTLINRTLVNMATAGELERCGTARAPGANRPLTLYRLKDHAQASAAVCAPWVLLAGALRPDDSTL